MKLYDFNNCPVNVRAYGGMSGSKVGIVFEGKNFLVKFPSNLRENQKNVVLSYSNSPVCEYLGSQIYKSLGLPVHNTLLGYRGDKLVVACEDFLDTGELLLEFEKLKVTYEPGLFDNDGNRTNGTGTKISECLEVIRNHNTLKHLTNVERHFWEMFVVDALIGNVDRNNGNWGIIVKDDKVLRLAPVYDNGNSFNCKWENAHMSRVLSDKKEIEREAYSAKTCIFLNDKGKRLNPYFYIKNHCDGILKDVLNDILTRVKDDTILDLIVELLESRVISSVQAEYYATMFQTRLKYLKENTTTNGMNLF